MDKETIQTLLDLLNPLHGSLDTQLYDDRVRDDFEIPRDREWSVNVTEGQDRDLTQAVVILEDRLRQAKLSEPHPGNEDGRMQPGSCARCGQFHSAAICPSAAE